MRAQRRFFYFQRVSETLEIAFVHDWLTTFAGAEKVLEAALEPYPGAPVHTLVYDAEAFADTLIARHPVYTSFIERLPWGRSKYRAYLPFMPIAIEQFDLSGYDVVVSSSHAVAKGALTRADQLHISYVHTPIRYAWDLQFQYLREAGMERGLRGMLARMVLHYIRQWDRGTANGVDVFVANSRYVARRIWKTYRREAEVIYPPVDVGRFACDRPRDDFYLTVSRFVPYKRIDLIVAAFARLGKPLIVIGDGPERDKVRALATPNVRLLGRQPDAVVQDYMERCRAFVFAADEDFGITPVEAQAAGAPVIAYGKGGVLETVLSGETGVLYDAQDEQALVRAVQMFEADDGFVDSARCRANAERFARARFQAELTGLISRSWDDFRG